MSIMRGHLEERVGNTGAVKKTATEDSDISEGEASPEKIRKPTKNCKRNGDEGGNQWDRIMKEGPQTYLL